MKKTPPVIQNIEYNLNSKDHSKMDVEDLIQQQKELMKIHMQVQESLQNIENKLTSANRNNRVSSRSQLFIHENVDNGSKSYRSQNSVDSTESHCNKPDIRTVK